MFKMWTLTVITFFYRYYVIWMHLLSTVMLDGVVWSWSLVSLIPKLNKRLGEQDNN